MEESQNGCQQILSSSAAAAELTVSPFLLFYYSKYAFLSFSTISNFQFPREIRVLSTLKTLNCASHGSFLQFNCHTRVCISDCRLDIACNSQYSVRRLDMSGSSPFRIIPHLPVSSLEKARDTFIALGFSFDSGSSKHSILSLSPTLSIQLNQSSDIPKAVYLTIELSGKQGIDIYRQKLQSHLNSSLNVTMGELEQVGWGKLRFSVTVEDGHTLHYTQEKQIYQG